MLCQPVHVLPAGPEWLYEVKWNGYRGLGSKLGHECHLFSRQGRPYDNDFPEIVAELCQLRCRSALVDGEIVAWDETGKPSLPLLQKRGRSRTLSFMVFDLIMLNGRDLRDKPLEFRRKALASIFPRGDVSLLSFSQELQTPTRLLMDQAEAQHLEGIIAKRRDSHYESGRRSGAWVKCRAEMTGDFVIGGYVPGALGFEELILGEQRGGQFHFVARLRGEIDPAMRRTIMDALRPLIQPACPFADLPEHPASPWIPALDADIMRQCHWVKPRGSVKVAFSEWTASRKLRNPRFIGLA